MSVTVSCPDGVVLSRFTLGQMPEAEIDRLGEHIAQCPQCIQTLDSLPQRDTFLEVLAVGPRSNPDDPTESVRVVIERLKAKVLATAESRHSLTQASTSHTVDRPDQKQPALVFLAPSELPDEIGRLGTYRVLKLIGQGGMGLVFQAEDIQLKRRVALKVMQPRLAQQPEARERFLREARAAAAIEHDHIVPIHQVGEANGVPFLAMPWLKGISLEERLRQTPPLSVGEIVRLGRQIASGLAVAHARGLIHRDIKPGNIWLEAQADESGSSGPGGRVKILDFGLVKPMEAASDLTEAVGNITRSGTILGTPAYMSPEQARSEPVDERSDLFSLGVVLYRMSTGQSPFQGATTAAVLMALAAVQPKSPSQLNPEIPEGLSDLILQLLAKDQTIRPASAREVGQRLLALEHENSNAPARSLWPHGGPSSVPAARAPATTIDLLPPEAPRPSRKRRLLVAAALLMLLIGGGAFALYQVSFETPQGTLHVQIDDPGIEARFKNGVLKLYGPDDKLLYSLKPSERNKNLPPGNYKIEVTGADGLTVDTGEFSLEKDSKKIVRVIVKPVAAPAETKLVATSPFDALDAAQIPVAERFDWQPKGLVAVLGEHHHRHWGEVVSLAYSPDGKYLISGGHDDSLRVWDAATMQELDVRKYPDAFIVKKVVFEPGRNAVIAACYRGGCYRSHFHQGKLTGETRLPGELTLLETVAYSPDGKTLAAGCIYTGTIFLWDLTDPIAAPRKVSGHTDSVVALAFSPDGKLLASGSSDKTFRLWDVHGMELTPRAVMTEPTDTLYHVAFSRDSKTLATSSAAGTCLWGIKSKEPEKWHEWKGYHQFIAFAAESNIFIEGASGPSGVITVWKVGTDQVEELVSIPGFWTIRSLSVSPDGKTLAVGWPHGLIQTWDVSGKTPKQLHPIRPDRHYSMAWNRPRLDLSVDGGLLACAALDGRIQLWNLGGPAPTLQRVLGYDCAHGLALSPAGTWLAVDRHNKGLVQLWKLNVTGEPPAQTLKSPAENFVSFSHDGSVLASWGLSNTVALWDMRGDTPREKQGLDIGHPAGPLVLTEDASLLAACHWGWSEVRVWDTRLAVPTKPRILTPQDNVWSLAFSPRSKVLACGCDRSVQLWDLTGGEAKAQAKWPGIVVISVAFAPAGDRLVTAEHSGKLTVWDLATQKPVWQRQLPGKIHKVLFAPDGRHLVTLNGNGTIYIYRLEGPPTAKQGTALKR